MTTPDEGLDKAALLLMTLGADAAAGVLRQLGPREVQKLSLKMSEMTPQARSAVEPVLAEMIESFGRGAMIQSDEDQLREMLTTALGDERAGQHRCHHHGRHVGGLQTCGAKRMFPELLAGDGGRHRLAGHASARRTRRHQ